MQIAARILIPHATVSLEYSQRTCHNEVRSQHVREIINGTSDIDFTDSNNVLISTCLTNAYTDDKQPPPAYIIKTQDSGMSG